MFEEILEDTAQKNGLRQENTYLKLLVGIGSILLCLFSTSYIAPLFIGGILTLGIIFLARVDAKTYAELFICPLWFAGMSVFCIILVYGGDCVFWIWHPVSWFSVSITRESINQGLFVFSRIIGGMSAVFFIALTTPMTDLFVVMRECRVPDIVVDLAMIIYRTIFILLNQLVQIYDAQVMRLGYSSWRESVQTFALLCGAAFIASWESGEDLIRAMEARCYDGKFALLGETRNARFLPVITVGTFLLVSSGVVVFTRGITIL